MRSPAPRRWTAPAAAADGALHARAAQPQLGPPRHDQPVRRVQHSLMALSSASRTATTAPPSSKSSWSVRIDKAVPAGLDVHSRINQVERWFGLLTDQMICRGVHKSVQALEADIRTWIENRSADPKPLTWTNPPRRS